MSIIAGTIRSHLSDPWRGEGVIPPAPAAPTANDGGGASPP